MPSIKPSWTARLLGTACAAGLAFGSVGAAQAESVLRVAMSAADIPDWTGAPDQGYEGYRFVGFTLYDSLVNWELAKHTDRAADIRPGLAESWSVDPNDHRKWIFKLRHGVKFHDGCDWNADSAIWNFKRVMDPTSPQYNVRHHAMQSWTIIDIASMEKIDDYTIAAHTKLDDSLLPYEIAGYFQISNCAVTKLHNDYAAFAKHPYGTGPYMFDKVVPHERLELVKNPNYWDKERIPKQDRLVLLPMPEASTRAAALLAGQVDFIEAPSPDTIPRLKQAGMQIVTVHRIRITGTIKFASIARRSTTSAFGRPPITPSIATKWWTCSRAWRRRATASSSRRSPGTATRSNTSSISPRRRSC